jgi:non-canonical purine NTP pyrophosphatase (RdgB/HAM1 family)
VNQIMKILFATHNLGKLKEIQTMLSNTPIEIISLSDLSDEEDVIENGQTYYENARIKAQHFYEKYHLPTLSDDSGLEVDALDFRPSIYSARYEKSDDLRVKKLLNELKDHQNRHATMISVLVYIDHDGIHTFEGRVKGFITKTPIGDLGFGYDPIFYIESLKQTFGQMSRELKQTMSHRGIAFKQFQSFLLKENL